MPKASDLKFDEDRETGYRRGYTHGVEAALSAVSHLIPEADQQGLTKWRERLRDWRMTKDGGATEAPTAPGLK